ncbi:MAG: patatin-like phospholipase family protein [Chitinophagales bacterium]
MHKLGLSLSGGGYRAAAFHLGTLKKLNELKILDKVEVLSTISGGSITGAYYCINSKSFNEFENYMVNTIENKNVIRSVLLSFSFLKLLLFVLVFLSIATYLLFTPYAWLSIPVLIVMVFFLLKYQFAIFPVSKEIEKAYDNFYYSNKTLKDLNDNPILAINSTNLQTARQFTFSKERMDDSAYAFMQPPIYFKNKDFPIARAVAASSCVPFAFTPISIKKEYFENQDDYKKINPKLVDGGVYDNQGIHKLTQEKSSYECEMIITSDAGNRLPFAGFYNNTIILLIRTVDVFMSRIESFQMVQNLYKNTSTVNKQIAYLSLGWDIENCIPGFFNNLVDGNITKEVVAALQLKPEWVEHPEQYKSEIYQHLEKFVDYPKISANNLTKEEMKVARSVGTNLTPLSKKQISCLMRQAENLTELQVKLYCPTLI